MESLHRILMFFFNVSIFFPLDDSGSPKSVLCVPDYDVFFCNQRLLLLLTRLPLRQL